MTHRYRWTRQQTRPIPTGGAFSPSDGPESEREALFDARLDDLVRAAHAEGCPVNPEVAWRQIEAGLAAPTRGGSGADRSPPTFGGYPAASAWRRLSAPFARIALAATAVGCLLLFLGWQAGGERPVPDAATHEWVRIKPAMWRAEVIAGDPLDGATDALINAVQDSTP